MYGAVDIVGLGDRAWKPGDQVPCPKPACVADLSVVENRMSVVRATSDIKA